jgi:hypothetical protein
LDFVRVYITAIISGIQNHAKKNREKGGVWRTKDHKRTEQPPLSTDEGSEVSAHRNESPPGKREAVDYELTSHTTMAS